jgi:hypothetical protein
MIVYTLDKINVVKNIKTYQLSESTLACLKDIEVLVGSPSYIKTPRFNQRNRDYENSKWENFRTFKKTVIVDKEATNIEKYKMDVRDTLNKLTAKTYDVIKNKLFKLLKELDTEELSIICPIIFDISSNNIFYSLEYSKLFKELINEFPPILSLFKSNFSDFLNIFKEIEYISPEDNYNEYCKINKTNEKRRALSKFFSNLMILEIIPSINILKIVLTLQERIVLYMNDTKNKHILEEITENICIIFDTIYLKIDKNDERLQLIITNIKWVLENEKEYDAITNKAVFKYMDILDHLKIEY